MVFYSLCSLFLSGKTLKNLLYTVINHFKNKKIEDLKISFRYKNRNEEFKVLSDIIFVVK